MLDVTNLKNIMNAKGINSLKELAKSSGLPYSTLNYMVSGHDMYIGTLAIVAHTLNEPIESFISLFNTYIIYYEKAGKLHRKSIIANSIYEVTSCYMM